MYRIIINSNIGQFSLHFLSIIDLNKLNRIVEFEKEIRFVSQMYICLVFLWVSYLNTVFIYFFIFLNIKEMCFN